MSFFDPALPAGMEDVRIGGRLLSAGRRVLPTSQPLQLQSLLQEQPVVVTPQAVLCQETGSSQISPQTFVATPQVVMCQETGSSAQASPQTVVVTPEAVVRQETGCSAQPAPLMQPVAPPESPCGTLSAADHALLECQRSAYGRLRAEMEHTAQLQENLLTATRQLETRLQLMEAEPDERVLLRDTNRRLRKECDLISCDVQRLRDEQARRWSLPHTLGNPQIAVLPSEDPSEGPQWFCGSCTFLNHPAISLCEQCEMPRLRAAPDGAVPLLLPAPLPPPVPPASASAPSAPGSHSGCYCHPGGGAPADRIYSWPEGASRRCVAGRHYRVGTL